MAYRLFYSILTATVIGFGFSSFTGAPFLIQYRQNPTHRKLSQKISQNL